MDPAAVKRSPTGARRRGRLRSISRRRRRVRRWPMRSSCAGAPPSRMLIARSASSSASRLIGAILAAGRARASVDAGPRGSRARLCATGPAPVRRLPLASRDRSAAELPPAMLERLDLHRSVGARASASFDNIRGAGFRTRGLILAHKLGEGSHFARAVLLEAGYRAVQGSPIAHRSSRCSSRVGALPSRSAIRTCWRGPRA